MYHKKRILALIPARKGSKRLPSKNILPFNGKPLIFWTISAAKKSMFVDEVMVSTDCEAIKEISQSYGALVPFVRPAELSTDESSIEPTIIHCLNFLSNSNKLDYDFLVLLQPTSPLRTETHIDSAIQDFIEDPNSKSLVSVCKLDKNPEWIKIVNDNGFLENIFKYKLDDKKVFIPNGAVYIASIKTFMDEGTFYTDKCMYYEMSRDVSIDIDNRFDFQIAEILKTDESQSCDSNS